jgi:geranylgeranyl diphosphate synthase type I
MSLPSSFYRYQAEIEAELKSVVGERTLPLYAMLRYHLGWVDEQGLPQENQGGKRVRPTLCLLACEAVGGDWRSALPAAAAIELVHNFSLIHDDIQDKSWKRRNRPAVWKVWGEAQGINAGDAMYALAPLALLRLRKRGITQRKIMLASCLLNQASLKVCEGQYMDIDYENRLDISPDNYQDTISRKTVPLFECALHLGALLGTNNQKLVSQLCSFGRSLGLAFQMYDDVQGIWGEEEIMGKPLYTDIRYKKKTLPIIYAFQKAGGEEKERLLSIYSKARISAEDITQMLYILDSLGARSYMEGLIKQNYLQALQELKRAMLPLPAQQELAEVAAFLLGQETER